MQPTRLGQRPTLVNTQGPIRLRHACYIKSLASLHAFLENVIIFVTTTPIDMEAVQPLWANAAWTAYSVVS